jgi:hypothetical protein
MKLIGILLILAGIAAVIYGGLSYTSHKKEVDIGPLQVEKTEHHTIPIPPILGLVGIFAGGTLFVLSARESH